MTHPSPAKDSGPDKRRSSRLVLALPIKVRGLDALQEPFTEHTITVMVSCHGCKYQSRHYVPKGSAVTLEVPRSSPDAPPRTVPARVIWVQRPRYARDVLFIGLEFDVPGNVWDIPMPPDDWFPLPGEPAFVMEEMVSRPVIPSAPPPPPAPPVTLTASWDASEILVMASRAEGHEAELAVAQEIASSTPLEPPPPPSALPLPPQREGIRTFGNGRKHDPQLHETIEQAVKASIDNLAESTVEKIAQQVAARTTEIVEEARRAYESVAEQLDAKIQEAVEKAINNGQSDVRNIRARRRR
ncbi:MAG: PilZ domain-containing protein [Candidatus Acidiferrales bacterium]